MKNLIIYLIAPLFSFSLLIAQEDTTYQLNDIVVTAGRSPISFSDLSRTVNVITGNELRNLPVNNIQDLLKFITGVDLRARGTEGVQADVSIRGGNFEQTLILLDGIKISDPQTGHHNLNVPVSTDNIERIEILKGQGSRIFGPNAFSGAINIITKRNNYNSLSISASAGEYGLYEAGITGYTSWGSGLSITKKKSDGYRTNTDFDISGFNLSQNIVLDKGGANFFYGFIDKKFGANSFYSDRFPDQWEHTRTKVLSAATDYDLAGVYISPKIFWRINNDDYYLDKNRPDWNHNIHETNSYGSEIQASLINILGTTSVGGEFIKDEISSTNLGAHSRNKFGFFAEHIFEVFEDMNISAGIFAYNYSSLGWKIWPGIEASYKFSPLFKFYASYGEAFRLPSFTELYYQSPANMGNPDLSHEVSNNYEAGLSISSDFIELNSNLFIKNGKNIIDWVRFKDEEPWKVENVTSINTAGFEIVADFHFPYFLKDLPIKKLGVQYTFISNDRTTGDFKSKYLLDNLRHQLLIDIYSVLPFELSLNLFFRYELRTGYENNFISDMRISKSIGGFLLFINANNLFNKSNLDIYGVPLPGRWISAGVKFEFSDF